MSKSSRPKDIDGNNGQNNQDTGNDGTSARTRPFSFEDIMVRRKSKNAVGKIHSLPVEAENREDIVEKASDGLQSDRDGHGKSTCGSSRNVSEDSPNISSRGIDDNNTSMIRDRNLAKDRANETQDCIGTKSKLAPVKSLTHENARGGKSERYVNHKKRNDVPIEDSKDESGERHSRDHNRREISMEKINRRSEKGREFKENNDNYDRPFNKRRRHVDQSRHDYENESHKRHSRHLTGTAKNVGHRVQSEKERKKKHHDEVGEKTEGRNGIKKFDFRASKSSKFSERKEKESSRMQHEEPRLKRRRSRSRDRDNDRGRRSPSLSPKVQKYTSYTEQEHGVLFSYSSKDRSQRSHINVERKKISSNGSNSNHKRYSGSSSGLGGYSPRRRKSDAARTSSPSNRSPERRAAGWDLPPGAKDGNSTGPVTSGLQSSNQITSSNAQEPSDVVPETSSILKPLLMPQYSSSHIHAVDSIQLTQATRPMRRLYVENLPPSASEKALMESINNFLLSLGVNRIRGTMPCISCMIHKEKCQALLEFLTPEDASAALSFDGRSFSGSIIKLRRPKDFIEVTTGVPDKLVNANYTLSDTVEDSSHKIFIGGISKLISSEMLIDIARAFGPLKAFHFEHNAEIDVPCAFLEYADHLVTVKACAGLNGMKLGGQVLTVVQAWPDASYLGDATQRSSYGIPEHAKPLLATPTEILKIKNVLDPDGIPSLGEADLEEILEDIRLECSRFGTVKAVNVVKQGNCSSAMESFADGGGGTVDHGGNQEEIADKTTAHEPENLNESKPPNSTMNAVEDNEDADDKPRTSNPLSSSTEPEDYKARVVNCHSDDKLSANIITDETCESSIDDKDMSVVKDAGSLENSGSSFGVHVKLQNSSNDLLVSNDKIFDDSATVPHEIEDKVNTERGSILEEDNARTVIASALNPGERKDSDIHDKTENRKEVTDLGNTFEPGSVLVEFRRAEASCMAAHCLHGRHFDDRIVTVEYVAANLYRKRFPK